MTSERIDDLIALAAMGELSAEEQTELDAAARTDGTVADELREALATAAALQRSTAEEAPSSLRSSVLSTIAATPQDAPGEASGTHGQADSDDDPVVAPVRLDEARMRRRRFVPYVAAAAAAIIMVVGAAVIVSTDDSSTDQVAAVVDSFDASTSILTGEFELLVTYSPAAGAVVVEGDQLPVLDDSETYQLWLVDDSGATSVGVFSPDDNGAIAMRFDGVDPTGFTLGVTEEPAGGSTSPTLPILTST